MSSRKAAIGRKGSSAKLEFRLESHVFYLISRGLALRNRALNRALGAHGFDYPRWRVLGVLGEHPGASMLKLAELTSVDRTTLAHTVRIMVEEGLIDREARQSDRRSVELRLTRKGAAALKRVLPLVLAQNERALSGLTTADVEQLRGLLRRVMNNLEE